MIKKIVFLILLTLNFTLFASPNKSNRQDDLEQFKDLSIIIPSYDKYSELWNPTLSMLFKHWSNLNTKYKNMPIYLMSNEEKFDHPRVTNILVGGINEGWSSNFLKALEEVKTKYVLIILDDYILNRQVDEKRLNEVLNLMRKTDGAYIQIGPEGTVDGTAVDGIDGVILRSRFGDYRTALQACIWNVEILKWLLRPGESIWDFEGLGNIRSSGVINPFYLVTDNLVVDYLNVANYGHYLKSVVDYINEQGIKFNPTKLPIDENR